MHLLVAATLAAVVVASSAAGPQGAGPDEVRRGSDVVTTASPVIRESLQRLWLGSPSWRAALDVLRGRDASVVVLTPERVVVERSGHRFPFDEDVLAEVSPVTGSDGAVQQVMVVVNLPLIESAHRRRLATMSEVHADLDRVVAHEVYGHALPYLIAGDLSGHCPDPAEGQRAVESCAIARENVIRAELRLGRRTDAGVHGLALARPFRY
jgi:hypothetical protein